MPDVFRTLVIGMGSCGAEVINDIIEKVNWQYGGLENTPWLKVHCFETNPGAQGNIPGRNFTHLQMTSAEYATIIQGLENNTLPPYLSSWLDAKTLRELPAAAVLVGAGGLRMAGRLAFFTRFAAIKGIVSGYMHELDGVAGGQIDGKPYGIEDQTRVFVVGSLCGGTCSGSCSDMGFLTQIIKQAVKTPCLTYGMFTIPYPDTAKLEEIETKKANAIHAIKELHTYSLSVGIGGAKSSWNFMFPDGSRVDEQYSPYDLTFILRPSQNTPNELLLMHQNIAERILHIVFEPEIDTMALGVDTGFASFSTFGLSSLMYPSFQIAEACASYAEWKFFEAMEKPSIVGVQVPGTLTSVGASNTVNELYNTQAGLAGISATDGLDKCRIRLTQAEAQKGQIRNLFLQQVWSHLRTTYGDYLQQVDGYLPRWKALLAELLDEESGVNTIKLVGYPVNWADPELMVTTPDKPGCWAKFFGVPGPAPTGNQALVNAVEQHRRYLASLVLDDNTISIIRTWLTQLQANLINTQDLITQWKFTSSETWIEKATLPPLVSGVAMFKPAFGINGTVWDVMRSVYAYHQGGIAAAAIDHDILQITHPQMLTQLKSWFIENCLPAGTMGGADARFATPVPHGHVPEWVYVKKQGYHRSMSRFFGNQSSVFDLWDKLAPADKTRIATEMALKSQVMLDIVAAGFVTAVGLYHNPLLHDGNANKDSVTDFHAEVAPHLPTAIPGKEIPSNNPDRAVLLQEVLKFHPASMTQLKSYLDAKGGHLTSRFTRKDVVWLGLTPEEMKRDMVAAETLAVSLLLGIVNIHGGNLKYYPGTTGIPNLNERSLPQNPYYASRLLAMAEHSPTNDVVGRPLYGHGLQWLNLQIMQHLEQCNRDPQVFWSQIEAAINNGVGGSLPCWSNILDYQTIMHRFASSFMVHHSDPLMSAKGRLLMKPAAALAYWLTAGSRTVRQTIAPNDGYYCHICGGPVGVTEEEAADNGWTCTYNPEHVLV